LDRPRHEVGFTKTTADFTTASDITQIAHKIDIGSSLRMIRKMRDAQLVPMACLEDWDSRQGAVLQSDVAPVAALGRMTGRYSTAD
jgi:hypothetical protein